MSGNRVALTLLHELRRRGGGLGAAALCGGGGQGDAILLRVAAQLSGTALRSERLEATQSGARVEIQSSLASRAASFVI